MGLFSKLASAVWGFTKKAVKSVWTGVLKPLAFRMAAWAGIPVDRVAAATGKIETTARRVVSILEADVGVLVRDVLNAAQLRFERWAVDHLGVIGAMLIVAIERLEEILGLRRSAVKVGPAEVSSSKIQNRKLRLG